MHRLVKVEQPSHWQSLHEIRREVLFETGIFTFRYDQNHPDDRAIGNTPYLLVAGDGAMGVVRLDERGAGAVVRLVGIRSAYQRQGLGRMLSDLIDREAASRGMRQLWVNAFVGAVPFYERTGWEHSVWDEEELAGLNGRGVQMAKRLFA